MARSHVNVKTLDLHQCGHLEGPENWEISLALSLDLAANCAQRFKPEAETKAAQIAWFDPMLWLEAFWNGSALSAVRVPV